MKWNNALKYGGAVLAGGSLAVLVSVWVSRTSADWSQPPVVHAQGVLVPWTAAGATGSVDESSLADFRFNLASAGYSSTSTSLIPLEFRYNVTNTYDNQPNPNVPGWTTLELGGIAPGTSGLSATLYKVQKCTGVQKVICATKIGGPIGNTCNTCQFPNNLVDFSMGVYYVDVQVFRNNLADNPMVNTLRIY